MDQLFLSVFGVLAVLLTQASTQEKRRWACVSGLLAQPFWFYSTWQASQWGIFVLSIVYASIWTRSFWVNWIRPIT